METRETQQTPAIDILGGPGQVLIVTGATGDAPLLIEDDVTVPPPHQARQVELKASVRERERILPPGAGGAFGDPYKILRTQILRRMDSIHANTIAILSPAGGDGKTLTAINLAIAIAAERSRTALLVDFNLRKPSLHRRFGFKPEVGIDDCLLQHRPVHEAMVKIKGYDRLTLLPARNPMESSSELLGEERTGQLVTELRGRYVNRVVIFDLPPALSTDDALAFSRHVQAGLLVIREGRTPRQDVTRTLDLMRDLTICGTVLNDSSESALPHE